MSVKCCCQYRLKTELKKHTPNIDGYNPNRKRKVLIVFDDMIVDLSNKKF